MVPSFIRTILPVIVGLVLGQAARLGFDLDEGTVTTVVSIALTGAYYLFARFVEGWWPAAGRFLLSLGTVKATPTYVKPEPAKLGPLPPRIDQP